MSLLRLIRALPTPAVTPVRVLGVDDFALRRGHRYGTVLVNMTTRQVIDVLADRSADTLATWLLAHPEVEIICRDRASGYTEGAARAAPKATQVADRWHLLHNLSDAVYKAVTSHRRCLRTTPQPEDAVEQTPPASPAGPMAASSRLAQRTRQRHREVHELREQSLGVYTIARRLGLDPKTVHRYAEAPDPQTLIGPNGTARDSILNIHKPYLRKRCADGVTGTNQLLTEVRERGYTGSERTLRRFLISIRGNNSPDPGPPPVPPGRDITGWIMRPADKLTDDDQAQLELLCQRCPDLATIRDLARGFTDLVRTRGGKKLHTWVERVEQGAIAEIRSFAAGCVKTGMRCPPASPSCGAPARSKAQ